MSDEDAASHSRQTRTSSLPATGAAAGGAGPAAGGSEADAALPPPPPTAGIPASGPSEPPPPEEGSRFAPAMVLGSLGVVYGDIGTSPLYALRESLVHAREHAMSETAVIGIVSMLVWTVMLIVTVKYVILILRADNNGEGGTLSLVAKAQGALGHRAWWLYLTGIVGVSLFFGDSMITPAISMLSAVEGITLVAPGTAHMVVPLTLLIVVALFWIQRRGTGLVSRLFGPIMLAWFLTMAALGASHMLDDARILHALNPLRAVAFIADNGFGALPVMGSVFLAVTGAEALYADMGHFGRRSIRIAWTSFVMPALILAYLGQGAMVLSDPTTADDPFFRLAPAWFTLPLVILATLATAIASQAVISGAFSVAQQAVQLGLLPRLEIQHTSDSQRGQIYLPRVNIVLMAGVVALIIGFGSSTRLASAYGIAVTADMVITSMLAIIVFRWAWKWPWAAVLAVMAPILTVELVFFYANLLKVVDGGYIPLLFAAVAITIMVVWLRGSQLLLAKLATDSITLRMLTERLEKSPPTIVPGTAVFLTADPSFAPAALLHNLKHNRVLHERNIVVKVDVATSPRVPDGERVRVERLGPRFWRVYCRFGYMEHPNVPRALTEGRPLGMKLDVMATSYFLNRRSLRVGKANMMPLWVSRLFVSLYRSASEPTNFYRLPSNRVIELGQQINI